MIATRPATTTAGVVAVLIGVLAAGTSLVMPLGIDEVTWLSVTRRIADGGTLYVDAIDNKSPAVFAFVYLLELFPGPFIWSRGVVVGVLAGWLAYGSFHLARSKGLERTSSLTVGALSGAGAAAMSAFLLTTELVAVSLTVGAALALTHRRSGLASTLAVVAALFDPRAALFIPGLVLLARDRGSKADAIRFALLASLLGAIVLAAVLVIDDWRYALVELNLASRQLGTWRPSSQLAVAAASLLPIAATLFSLHRTGHATLSKPPSNRSGWLLVTAGFVGAAVSLQPFHHYWVLLVPWLGLVLTSRVRAEQPIRAGIAALAVALSAVPLVINSADWRSLHEGMLNEYAEVASSIEATLGEGELFAQFALHPHPSYLLPHESAMRSPGVNYLVWPSSRREAHLAELEALMPQVGAVIDTGGLTAPARAVQEDARPLWRILKVHVAKFPCVLQFGDAYVHLRIDRCPGQ